MRRAKSVLGRWKYSPWTCSQRATHRWQGLNLDGVERLEDRTVMTAVAMSPRERLAAEGPLEISAVEIVPAEIRDGIADIQFASSGSEFVVFQITGVSDSDRVTVWNADGSNDLGWQVHRFADASILSNSLSVVGTTPAQPGNLTLRLDLRGVNGLLDGAYVLAWVGLTDYNFGAMAGRYDPLQFGATSDPNMQLASYYRYVDVNQVVPNSDAIRIDLAVEPGEYWDVALSRGQSLGEARLYDHRGNLMTSNAYFALSNRGAATRHFYLEVNPNEDVVELSAVKQLQFDSLPTWTAQATVDPDGFIDVELSMPLDERNCSLADFSWDGPKLVDLKFINGHNLELYYQGVMRDRNYELKVLDGACQTTAGGAPESSTILIDHIAPKISQVPVRDRGWTQPGNGVLTMRFDEPIVAWSRHSDIWGTLDGTLTGKRLIVGLEDVVITSEDITFFLGELPDDYYQLTIHGVEVWDAHLNTLNLDGMTMAFDVSAWRAEQDSVPWDVDGDAMVDQRDFWAFDYAMKNSPTSFFDLNNDQRVDVRDETLWLSGSSVFAAGDVNLDGVFDTADLISLGQAASDQPANWFSGDFDGDGAYTTSDLILAMQGGLYRPEDDE